MQYPFDDGLSLGYFQYFKKCLLRYGPGNEFYPRGLYFFWWQCFEVQTGVNAAVARDYATRNFSVLYEVEYFVFINEETGYLQPHSRYLWARLPPSSRAVLIIASQLPWCQTNVPDLPPWWMSRAVPGTSALFAAKESLHEHFGGIQGLSH